jgi:hypothetical protein
MTLDDFFRDNSGSVVAVLTERMRDDAEMVSMAAERGASPAQICTQVLGFWLEAIRSDLAVGSTIVMAQNLLWLKRFRAGHQLPFGDDSPGRMFAQISREIESRLSDPVQLARYAVYRTDVERLIEDTFCPDRVEQDARPDDAAD